MKKILLTDKQHKLLTKIINATTTPQRFVLRSTIILDYVANNNQSRISRKFSIDRNTVRHWLVRWQDAKSRLADSKTGNLSDLSYSRLIMDILADAPRPGAPKTFTQEQKQQITAVASEKPEKEGVPATHWTHKLLAQHVRHKGIVTRISPAHLGRFLKESDITTTPE